MDKIEAFRIILPGIIAVLGNIIIYFLTKSYIDKALEQHKVAFSEVYKEKLKVYKTILNKSYDLRNKVYTIQFKDKPAESLEGIWADFEDFKRFYIINKPFITSNVIAHLEELAKELQSVFMDFNSVVRLKDEKIFEVMKDEIVSKFWQSSTKLRQNNPESPFNVLDESIENEVKKELRIK